jgi:hypothetical protein
MVIIMKKTPITLLPVDLRLYKDLKMSNYFSYRFLAFVSLFAAVVLHFSCSEFNVVASFAGLSFVLLAYDNFRLNSRIEERYQSDYIVDIERRVDRIDESLHCLKNKCSARTEVCNKSSTEV